MGWVSLRLWSFSPGKVVKPGCLLWSNPAPLQPHWCTPVILDLIGRNLFDGIAAEVILNRLKISVFRAGVGVTSFAGAGVCLCVLCVCVRGGGSKRRRVGRLGRVLGLDFMGRVYKSSLHLQLSLPVRLTQTPSLCSSENTLSALISRPGPPEKMLRRCSP